MAKKRVSPDSGAMATCLSFEDFDALTAKLVRWRLNPDVRLMDSERAEGRILGFVKGLRLSAQVAYLLRNILAEHDVEVSWGHLIDEYGRSCSPECDVIIHHKGHYHRWNGGEKPIMDFRFIQCSKAIAIVSCKSFAKNIDIGYCEKFKEFGIDNILLFAECCKPEKADLLKSNAIKHGYQGFYYLYTLSDDDSIDQNENVYKEFIESILNSLPK